MIACVVEKEAISIAFETEKEKKLQTLINELKSHVSGNIMNQA